MDSLKNLIAQQQSPVEVLVFLVLIMMIFLLMSSVIYVVLMVLMRVTLPAEVTLRKVLFPSARQIRENIGNYVLIAATSLLLTLTLITKHELVSQISEFKLTPDDMTGVSQLFDFGMPEALSNMLVSASLSDVVRPMLANGKLEKADLLVRSIIGQQQSESWLNPKALVIACLTVAVLYLMWLAVLRRSNVLETSASPPQTERNFHGLLILAFCTGLLLASSLPFIEESNAMLARSTLGAIEESDVIVDSQVYNAVAEELERQQEEAQYLYCPECTRPGDNIWKAVDEGASSSEDVLRDLRNEADALLARLKSDADAHAAQLLEQQRRRQAQLEDRLTDFSSRQDARQQRQDQLLADFATGQKKLLDDAAGQVRALQARFETMEERLNAVIRRLEARNEADGEITQSLERLQAELQNLRRDLERSSQIQQRLNNRLSGRLAQIEERLQGLEALSHSHSRVVQ